MAIGIGSGLLATMGLDAWFVPWVALVVGLHFISLGYLLRLNADYLAAAAQMTVANVKRRMAAAGVWSHIISLGTALLLWLAGWGRLLLANKGKI